MHTNQVVIRLLDNSLEFKPEKWAGALKGAGCYPYAANFYYPKFIRIGELIGFPCGMESPDEELVRALQEELLYMGYQSVEEVRLDYQTGPGEVKIYLQRIEGIGVYHMFRQNRDGTWSHKYKNELPRNINYDGQPIYNPEKASDMPSHGWCFLLKHDLL